MKDIEWRLLHIHPFTQIEAAIIELKANGMTNKEIAEELHYSEGTIRLLISGYAHPKLPCHKGIVGKIEDATKRRPPRGLFLMPLFGDVLMPFEKET